MSIALNQVPLERIAIIERIFRDDYNLNQTHYFLSATPKSLEVYKTVIRTKLKDWVTARDIDDRKIEVWIRKPPEKS